MADTSRFRALSNKEKALVAIAVLMDGFDAVDYFGADTDRKVALQRASKDLAELSPELRIPLLGTLLRQALSNI